MSTSTSKFFKTAAIYFFLCFFIPAIGCKTGGEKATTSERSSNIKTEKRISGTITQTSDYCGGIPPTDELLEILQNPRPYPGKAIYIRSGNQNSNTPVILKFYSDDEGKFSIKLEPGTYCLIDSQRVEKLNINDFKKDILNVKYTSEDCLREWWKSCYATLEVGSKDIKDFNIHFHHKCFIDGANPCLRYVGPMPP